MYNFCDQAAMICKAWELDQAMKAENKCENFHGKLMRFFMMCGQHHAKLANDITMVAFDDYRLYHWSGAAKHYVIDLTLDHDQRRQRPEDYC